MSTCSTCKHWKANYLRGVARDGVCGKIGGIDTDQSGPAILSSWHGEGATLTTLPTFGCNLYGPTPESTRLKYVETMDLFNELVARGLIATN